jgi:hypothetical protein
VSAGAPTRFQLTRPRGCGVALAARRRPRGARTNGQTTRESAGAWDPGDQYQVTAGVGTQWTLTQACSRSTTRVASGVVRVTNLITHRTTLLTAGQSLTASAG